jgi:hypothetical protein
MPNGTGRRENATKFFGLSFRFRQLNRSKPGGDSEPSHQQLVFLNEGQFSKRGYVGRPEPALLSLPARRREVYIHP